MFKYFFILINLILFSNSQADNKENSEIKVESKEEQTVISTNTSISGKNDTKNKENAES